MRQWIADAEVQALARSILECEHEDLAKSEECGHELAQARVLVLFREPCARSAGRDILGKAAKASAKDLALLDGREADFVITLSAEHWQDLDETERRALLDHELQHCTSQIVWKKTGRRINGKAEKKPERKWCMRGHDFEEFEVILRRHGAWTDALKEAGGVFRQLSLFRDLPETKLRAV